MSVPEVEIRSNTVLLAQREPIELCTADGLRLVGELATPLGRLPKAILVTCHPLPTAGGFMDSHIFKKAAARLPELADLAVLRFNTRGTTSPAGTSEGSFDEGLGERLDLLAAADFARARFGVAPWLVGWSFGTELILNYGLETNPAGAVLLSPPLHRTQEPALVRWEQAAHIPISALIPELDDFLPPPVAREKFAPLPRLNLIEVPDAKHLWVGEKSVRIVLEQLVRLASDPAFVLPHTIAANRLASP